MLTFNQQCIDRLVKVSVDCLYKCVGSIAMRGLSSSFLHDMLVMYDSTEINAKKAFLLLVLIILVCLSIHFQKFFANWISWI
jgi:hypothetical protein